MAEWIIEIKDGKFPIGKWTELVRCKNCKWYTPFRNIQGGEMGEGECEGYDPCVPANHFCSRGERKEKKNELHN